MNRYLEKVKIEGNKAVEIYYDYVQDILLSHFIDHDINVVGGSMIFIMSKHLAVLGIENGIDINSDPKKLQREVVEMSHRIMFDGDICKHCSIPMW